jgi:hypothetical protein
MNASMQTTISRFDAFRTPIDATLFRETWNVDPHNHCELLSEYADASADDTATLLSAVSRQNRTTIMNTAHRIAGASQIIGAVRVVAACRRLELAARDHEWPALPALAAKLCCELDHVRDFINSIEAIPTQ